MITRHDAVMPLIPALSLYRQENCYKLKVYVGYIEFSRSVRAISCKGTREGREKDRGEGREYGG